MSDLGAQLSDRQSKGKTPVNAGIGKGLVEMPPPKALRIKPGIKK